MAQWDHTPTARLATFLTLDDIARAKATFTAPPVDTATKTKLPHAQKESAATPVLNLIKEAKGKGYETICLPLTTEKWKERWEGMCLLPVTPGTKPEEGKEREEDMEEIGSDNGSVEDREAGISKDEEAKKKKRAEAAEQWRAKPAFLVEEVTITRLNEAEGITAMISDWLELDAEDDGIRHDAEIVSFPLLPFCFSRV